MSPEEFKRIEKELIELTSTIRNRIAAIRCLVDSKPPDAIREATAEDIRIGAIIWHWREEEHGGWYWHEVVEVMYPDDDFWSTSWTSQGKAKAYVADDGCRYGLHHAWVMSDDRRSRD